MSLRAQRSLGVASIVVAALAYRQLLFWNPGSILLPPFQAWLVLPSGTSPQLILALVAALLYRKRERLREAVTIRQPPLPDDADTVSRVVAALKGGEA